VERDGADRDGDDVTFREYFPVQDAARAKAAGERMTIERLIDGARHARWLTRERIIAGGQALLLIELTILVLLALWQHGVITDQISRTSSDFVSFYAAGKLALAGTPALAYDQAAHFLTEQRFTVEGAPYQFFFYPPVFMLLFAPLALLPYYLAFYVFEIATLAAFLFTMRRIVREPGWLWAGPVLAFPAIFWTFGLGQNAFLTAALFGGFTLSINRRPALAGVLLGLLCYKPHFGLLAPIGLACGGHWRAFLAAGATVACLVMLSVALFGVDTWQAYLSAFAGSDAVYASGRIDYAGIVTPFGAARLLGFAPSASYLVQAVITGCMALLVAVTWWRRPGQSLSAATLLSATLLAVPLALLYDKLLLLVAIGWLARDARRNGFLPWEKTVLLAVWLGSMAEYAIGSAFNLPLGPLISFAILLLALRRVERAMVARSGETAPSRISQAVLSVSPR
jgi:alpha-1,2-mannosyltransferase